MTNQKTDTKEKAGNSTEAKAEKPDYRVPPTPFLYFDTYDLYMKNHEALYKDGLEQAQYWLDILAMKWRGDLFVDDHKSATATLNLLAQDLEFIRGVLVQAALDYNTLENLRLSFSATRQYKKEQEAKENARQSEVAGGQSRAASDQQAYTG